MIAAQVIPIFLFQTFCNQAYNRVVDNLNALKDPVELSDFKTMAEISKGVCKNGGLDYGNPLGV